MTTSNELILPAKDRGLMTLDDLRARVRPTDCLDEIHNVDVILKDQWQDLRKNQIDALRLRKDIQFSLLNKLFPDLKAVDSGGNEPKSKVQFVFNLGGEPVIKEVCSI